MWCKSNHCYFHEIVFCDYYKELNIIFEIMEICFGRKWTYNVISYENKKFMVPEMIENYD